MPTTPRRPIHPAATATPGNARNRSSGRKPTGEPRRDQVAVRLSYVFGDVRPSATVRRIQVIRTGACVLALRDQDHPRHRPARPVPAPRRCAVLAPLPVPGCCSEERL